MSDDLVAFLRARLDEDEAAARSPYPLGVESHLGLWRVANPARVLAEVEAKRQIVELHSTTVEKADVAPYDSFTGERSPDEYNVTCAICGWASDDPTSGCLTLRLLALPYADHPDYREDWRPDPA